MLAYQTHLFFKEIILFLRLSLSPFLNGRVTLYDDSLSSSEIIIHTMSRQLCDVEVILVVTSWPYVW